MCSRFNCNQDSYFESSDGLCYYHWKISQGLIEEKGEYLTPADKRMANSQKYWKKKLYNQYQSLVNYIVGRTKGVTADDKPDLAQELYIKLWVITQSLDTTKDEALIYTYILTSLLNVVGDFRRRCVATSELDERIEHPFDLEDSTSNNINKYIIYNIINIYINNYLSSERDRYIFINLFITEDTIPVRQIATDLDVNFMWVHRRGQVLFQHFKEFFLGHGYTVDDFFEGGQQ